MRSLFAVAGFLSLTALASTAWTQEAEQKPAVGPKLGQEHVQKYRFGVSITSVGGTMSRKLATTTIPTDWPEQTVKIVDKDLSPGVTIGYRTIGTAKQLVVNVPRLAADQEAHGVIIAEVTRYTLLPPDDAHQLVVPNVKTLPADTKIYMAPSPTIESTHAKVKEAAKEIADKAASEKASAWKHVRAIYDWVRSHIEYKARDGGKYESESSASSCVVAMEKGTGNCNELTSTFVALCRASGIPARTIRIPGHCYPEFYLEVSPRKGGWFPAEVSGSDSFGGVFTSSPILQKGDAFKVAMPGKKTDIYRFLPETLTGMSTPGDTGQPTMKLICEPVKE